jgi:SH3-like domain-containing protein
MRFVSLPFLVLFLSISAVASAEEIDNTSHLPIPRFASLRSDEVNMRAGPGLRYPIAWVYTRRGLPVEITAEYDIWRRVRDPDGTEGWISRAELSGKRSAIITANRDLRDKRDDQAAVRAHLQAGALGQIVSCEQDWCKVRFDNVKGFLRKTEFWGSYPNEVFD